MGLALIIRFEGVVSDATIRYMLEAAPLIFLVYMGVNVLGRVYQILWRCVSGHDLFRLGFCYMCSFFCTLLLNEIHAITVSRMVLLLICMIAFIIICFSRYIWRYYIAARHAKIDLEQDPRENSRLLIVGAGNAGAWAVAQCREQHFGTPIAMVDDAPIKLGLRIQNVPVLGSVEDIPKLVVEKQIDDIIIAIPSLKGKRLSEIATISASTGCRVTSMTLSNEIDASGKTKTPIMRRLNTADFLSRDEVKLNTASIEEYLTGATVLVTGGGGSIGSEISRQVMKFKPKQLIVFDVYENCAYELYRELQQSYGDDMPVKVLVGSARDRERLDEIMTIFRPSVVFHAAAHKHVPLMEVSPTEAVKNNVLGTLNTLLSAAEHGVERFVTLSTDKAVNPTNVMGATKRITEMIIQTLSPKYPMKCMAVRFGNVLGSHGSVIPLFEEQIRKGGPVTITDPDMTRYFMTIPEAAQLVLQAGGNAMDGAIFVLDMGEPVKIIDLAKQLIQFYGYVPDVDIKIKTIGLRPGEKMYEELMMGEEKSIMSKTAHDLILVAPPIVMEEELFLLQLKRLEGLCKVGHDQALVNMIAEMVPTYTPGEHWQRNKEGTELSG